MRETHTEREREHVRAQGSEDDSKCLLDYSNTSIGGRWRSIICTRACCKCVLSMLSLTIAPTYHWAAVVVLPPVWCGARSRTRHILAVVTFWLLAYQGCILFRIFLELGHSSLICLRSFSVFTITARVKTIKYFGKINYILDFYDMENSLEKRRKMHHSFCSFWNCTWKYYPASEIKTT